MVAVLIGNSNKTLILLAPKISIVWTNAMSCSNDIKVRKHRPAEVGGGGKSTSPPPLRKISSFPQIFMDWPKNWIWCPRRQLLALCKIFFFIRTFLLPLRAQFRAKVDRFWQLAVRNWSKSWFTSYTSFTLDHLATSYDRQTFETS